MEYKVQDPPGVRKKTVRKSNKALAKIRDREKAEAVERRAAWEAAAVKPPRRASATSLLLSHQSITYSGEVYRFVESDTADGNMPWELAEAAGIPRPLFVAIDESGDGVIQAAEWDAFAARFLSAENDGDDETPVATVTVTHADLDLVVYEHAMRQAGAEQRRASVDAVDNSVIVNMAESEWFVGTMLRDECRALVLAAKSGNFLVRATEGGHFHVVINDNGAAKEVLIDHSVIEVEADERLDHTEDEFHFNGKTYGSIHDAVLALRGSTIMSEVRPGEPIEIGTPAPGGKPFNPLDVLKQAPSASTRRASIGAADADPPSSADWFVGDMPKSKAEKLLTREYAPVGCFLVRAAHEPGTFTLKARDLGGHVRNFAIKSDSAGKLVAGKKRFENLDAAVESFRGRPLKSKDTAGGTFELAGSAAPSLDDSGDIDEFDF